MVAEVTAEPAGEIFMKLAADQYGQGRKNPIMTKSGHTIDIELHLHHELPVDDNVPRNAR